MRKFEIANALVPKYGYRTYLEICTPMTGGTFRRTRSSQLRTCHRMMYRCPQDFADGGEITFRSPNEQIEGLLPEGAQYDLVFVDAWHTYACASRDLAFAFSLLSPGGTLLVHDCSPPSKEVAAPEFDQCPWCGVTYCAFLDLVCVQPGIDYRVVDTDYGCGIVRKSGPGGKGAAPRERQILDQWRLQRAARALDVFDFFAQHRRELLNLVSVDQFLAQEAIAGPHALLRFARRIHGWERVESRLHSLLFAG